MCATDTRTELPLAAEQSGCSCCSTDARTQALPAAEGTEYSLEGLTCGHCVETVEKAIAAVDGVMSASVDLVAGGISRVTVSGIPADTAVRDAVTAAGYSLSNSR